MTQSMGLLLQILNKPSSLSEKGRYLREEKKVAFMCLIAEWTRDF